MGLRETARGIAWTPRFTAMLMTCAVVATDLPYVLWFGELLLLRDSMSVVELAGEAIVVAALVLVVRSARGKHDVTPRGVAPHGAPMPQRRSAWMRAGRCRTSGSDGIPSQGREPDSGRGRRPTRVIPSPPPAVAGGGDNRLRVSGRSM